MYDLYFLRRFIEEMVLAQTAGDEHERAVHLKACRYYGDILHMNDGGGPDDWRDLPDSRDDGSALPP